MRNIMIALSAFTLAATATAASAEDFVVEHSDLDLSDKHDQKVLKSRISRAAKDYCGGTRVRTGTRVRSSDESRCIAQTTRLASEKMAALIDAASKGG